MYSFLDDKELYGSTLSGQASPQKSPPRNHTMQPAGPVRVQMQQTSREGERERDEALQAQPAPQAPKQPQPVPEIFLRAFSLLEQRLLGLEERIVVALERMSSYESAPKPSSNGFSANFWFFLIAVAVSTALTFFLFNATRWRAVPLGPAMHATHQASMPFLIQSLPAAHVSGPPTPILFSAPSSFLPRA
jgi:hypothetical protein